ncbi:hypothetical protein V8E51_013546 [Hyaloscypha variabilis]
MRLLISSDLFCLLPGVRHLLPATWFLKDWFSSCWWFLAEVIVPPLEIEVPWPMGFCLTASSKWGVPARYGRHNWLRSCWWGKNAVSG